MSERFNREGFWANPESTFKSARYSKLPVPRTLALEWEGKEEFLKELISVEERCRVEFYRGSSHCRICGIHNGSAENYWSGWTWPSGYRHYIEHHNVRPSLAFQEMILNREV